LQQGNSSMRDAVGVPIPPEVQVVLDLNGTIPAGEFKARLSNVSITATMVAPNAVVPGAQLSDVVWGWDTGVGAAFAAPEVSGTLNGLTNSSSSSNRTVSLAASGNAASAQGSSSLSGSSSDAGSPAGTVSASFLIGSGWGGGIDPWNGWACGGSCGAGYGGYYKWWKEHYFLRNLYMNLRIPPKTNPCKYYKVRSDISHADWLGCE
jgi:hypothetical protein